MLRRLGFRRADGPARSVLLVCSPGGHLQQLMALEPAWEGLRASWVTLPGADVERLLEDRVVDLAHGPTNRDLGMLIRNLPVAWRVIRARDPDAILSTGAGVCVPFFWVGRLLGAHTVYLEVYDRIDSATMTGRLCHPVTELFLVQWPEQEELYRGTVVAGPVY
jgi:UDP-N-acetylglucosamine:LPS N-acetylglucosamine transferase